MGAPRWSSAASPQRDLGRGVDATSNTRARPPRYLNALEGDFWVKIRGAGLAYSASVRGDARQGLVHFSLYRSADPKGALDAAKAIVEGYASGEAPIRPLDFTNARGSLASGLVEGEKTRSQALAGAWRRTLLGQDADRNRQYRGPAWNHSFW